MFYYIIFLLGLILVWHVIWLEKKRRLSQPPLATENWLWWLPGQSLLRLAVAPVHYFQAQIDAADRDRGVAMASILGRPVLFVTRKELMKCVFSSLEEFQLYAHPRAHDLFGPTNMIYMGRTEHKDLRARLIGGLFSKEALALYGKAQRLVVNKHLGWWADAGSEQEAREVLRYMTADASQEAFLGPHLNKAEKAQLTQDLLLFTRGFLAVPVVIPGLGLWRALRARRRIVALVLSKIHLAQAETVHGSQSPRCLLDFWLGARDPLAPEEMAVAVLDFLFASQDATTAASVWVMHLLTEHPAVLQSVAADPGRAPIVAAEALRARPPVPMVPLYALKDNVDLGDGIIVPRNTIVINSLTGGAAHEPEAGEFARAAECAAPLDGVFNHTLVFGSGPHKCPGRYYAAQLVAVFVQELAANFHFKRRLGNSGILYAPTLYPVDNLYTLTRRNEV